jgi:hypothetical protein
MFIVWFLSSPWIFLVQGVVLLGPVVVVEAGYGLRAPPSSPSWFPLLLRHRNLHHDTDVQQRPQHPQTNIRQYELWSSQVIVETIQRWADHYPDLVELYTSQDRYGLPRAGGANDCPFEAEHDGCSNYVLIIQDKVAHPHDSESSRRLPEVLWSGNVHGNERVGPTAVLEAAELLLQAATCEALPRVALRETEEWPLEIEKARSCRNELMANNGIDDDHRKWLARLVTTRRIVIVPTANALGYFRNRREENGIDPNRDFPYDITDPTDCMQTIAGRTLNEVFREHLFQLSLTFHGGMEVIGYEWGAPTWLGKGPSPDDTAQAQIATAYADFAGRWTTTQPYEHGTMNDLVYPVNGGMEDWAYAGSWDSERVIQCQPTTFQGYDPAKTTYDNATLRVFNMLVETSDNKTPPKSDLGTTEEIMYNTVTGNGHVARNIRVALLSAELVEPYLQIESIQSRPLSDHIIPLVDRHVCTQTIAVPYDPQNTPQIRISWYVGGALQVNDTQLYYAPWGDVRNKMQCKTAPPANLLVSSSDLWKPATSAGPRTGTKSYLSSSSSNSSSLRFSATLNVSDFSVGDRLALVARALVDPEWGRPLRNAAPDLPPQSHMANVRTNPDWFFQKPENGHIVQGQLDWFSIPIQLVLTQKPKPDEEGSIPDTMEITVRYDPSLVSPERSSPQPSGMVDGGHTDPQEKDSVSGSGPSRSPQIFPWIVVVLVAMVGFGGGRTYIRYSMRQTHRERVREFIADETAVSPGLHGVVAAGAPNKHRRNGYQDVDAGDEEGVELGSYT